jgi:hypothetical protein
MFVVLETETRVGGTLLHGRFGKEEQRFTEGEGVWVGEEALLVPLLRGKTACRVWVLSGSGF